MNKTCLFDINTLPCFVNAGCDFFSFIFWHYICAQEDHTVETTRAELCKVFCASVYTLRTAIDSLSRAGLLQVNGSFTSTPGRPLQPVILRATPAPGIGMPLESIVMPSTRVFTPPMVQTTSERVNAQEGVLQSQETAPAQNVDLDCLKTLQEIFALDCEQDEKPRKKRARVAAQDEPEGFAEFWQAYPRKINKTEARRAYKAAAKKVKFSDLVAYTKRFASSCAGQRTDVTFIPHPATWLRGERWLNETLPVYDNAPADIYDEIF